MDTDISAVISVLLGMTIVDMYCGLSRLGLIVSGKFSCLVYILLIHGAHGL